MRGDHRRLAVRREALGELAAEALRRVAGADENEAPTLPLDECRLWTHETHYWITVTGS